jgi:hypothetical protein
MDPRHAVAPFDPRGSVAQGPAALQLPEGGLDNPDLLIKLIIPDEKAYDLSQGGRSHMKLKQIQSTFNVNVRLASPGCFFPGSGDERALLISGYSESVRHALAKLLEIVEDDPSNPLAHIALPSSIVNAVLLASGGQASKYVGQTTHTQLAVLPPLPNFDETVLRIARFSRTPEAPVVCVANSAVLTIRIILEADPNFQFNNNLNYESGGGIGTDQIDEYDGPTFMNPQDSAKLRIEFLKDQLARLTKGEHAYDSIVSKREWCDQVANEESEIEYFKSLPTPPPQPPNLDEILTNAAGIASSLPHVLQMQCMVRVPRVNNKQASACIGVKGANIRDIQEASGAKVKIIDSPDAVHTGGIGPSATSLKEVVVTGQVNQVHAALIGIAELMFEADRGATEAVSQVSAWLRMQQGIVSDRQKRVRR